MRIDNFDLIREKILRFDNPGDFYFVLILKRRKDKKGEMVEGVNEDNRLIKHFFIYSKEYFDRKKDVIINLCEQNDARAYILPQRRNEVTVLCSLLVKVVGVIVERLTNAIAGLFKARRENKNLRRELRLAIQGRLSESDKTDILTHLDVRDAMDRKAEEGDGKCGIHFDHLIRSCVAGCHTSDRKMWVIDLDCDGKHLNRMSGEDFEEFKFNLIDSITEVRRVYHQDVPYECTIVPTPHGSHIVTEPFNKSELVQHKRTPHLSDLLWDPDWLKEDAMTIIYSNLKNNEDVSK